MNKCLNESRIMKILLVTFILTAAVSFGIIRITASSTPVPGSNQDPLVTKSYVDLMIAEALSGVSQSGSSVSQTQFSSDDAAALMLKITELENRLKGFEAEYNYSTSMISGQFQKTKFNVVQLYKGQKLLLGEGTEVILRAGIANAISGPGGDMSNLTTGLNVPDGSKIDANHLIISSRDDGRGFTIVSDSVWVLVKGSYKVVS